MTNAQIVAALKAFGLTEAEIAAPKMGYRNVSYAIVSDDKYYNLLVHKNEPGVVSRIKRTNSLGMALHRVGIPVRYPLDMRILAMRMGSIRYAALYNYLPGATIPWESFTMKHIKLLGWAMGSLHSTMAQLSLGGFPVVYEEYQAVLKRIEVYFDDTSIRKAIKQKLGVTFVKTHVRRLAQFLQACAALPRRQLLHMDLVRGNVLYGVASSADVFCIDTVALTGVIDFEKAAIGHPFFDIARTLSFLLVDCSTKTEKQLYKYFLQSGYVKRGGCSLKPELITITGGEQCDLLETAIDLFLLYDFYKFLRSNPYESLSENYHYVRTRDQLLNRGIVAMVP